jgi:hypothetical protein
MPSDAETLCLFGDSHLAALKRALDDDIAQLPGYEAEFWGAKGAQFRQLVQDADGRIRPGREAAEMVALINGRGRMTLAPADFDVFLFWGARLRVAEFLAPFLHRSQSGTVDSFAVLSAAAAQFLTNCRSYRFARSFARAGAEVWMIPAPLPTAGVKDFTRKNRVLAGWERATGASAADRLRLWSALESVAAQDGVRLIRQPEDTVTGALFTDARYAVAGVAETEDAGHKSPAYAARLLAEFTARRPARVVARSVARSVAQGDTRPDAQQEKAA